MSLPASESWKSFSAMEGKRNGEPPRFLPCQTCPEVLDTTQKLCWNCQEWRDSAIGAWHAGEADEVPGSAWPPRESAGKQQVLEALQAVMGCGEAGKRQKSEDGVKRTNLAVLEGTCCPLAAESGCAGVIQAMSRIVGAHVYFRCSNNKRSCSAAVQVELQPR